jgi:hypothetical protein
MVLPVAKLDITKLRKVAPNLSIKICGHFLFYVHKLKHTVRNWYLIA